jgi:hypothetical protein
MEETLDDELSPLIQNKTQCLDNLPPNRSLVTCKLVLHKKYSFDGSILKYKTPFMLQGFY